MNYLSQSTVKRDKNGLIGFVTKTILVKMVKMRGMKIKILFVTITNLFGSILKKNIKNKT
jgi:hypothetical protein